MAELRCWQCDAFQPWVAKSFVPAKPARPARLFGLIPAREATPAQWRCSCHWCDAEWSIPVAQHVTRRNTTGFASPIPEPETRHG